METHVCPLHGNITSDVKKKRGGGRPHELQVSSESLLATNALKPGGKQPLKATPRFWNRNERKRNSSARTSSSFQNDFFNNEGPI
jgi:hypothetical protein